MCSVSFSSFEEEKYAAHVRGATGGGDRGMMTPGVTTSLAWAGLLKQQSFSARAGVCMCHRLTRGGFLDSHSTYTGYSDRAGTPTRPVTLVVRHVRLIRALLRTFGGWSALTGIQIAVEA